MSCLLAGRLGGVLDGAPLFMCKGCGAYASAKCVTIKQRCPLMWGGRKMATTGFSVESTRVCPRFLLKVAGPSCLMISPLAFFPVCSMSALMEPLLEV